MSLNHVDSDDFHILIFQFTLKNFMYLLLCRQSNEIIQSELHFFISKKFCRNTSQYQAISSVILSSLSYVTQTIANHAYQLSCFLFCGTSMTELYSLSSSHFLTGRLAKYDRGIWLRSFIKKKIRNSIWFLLSHICIVLGFIVKWSYIR